MRVVKAIIAAALLFGAWLFIRGSLYEQYRCHLLIREVSNDTSILRGMRDSVLVSIHARDNLARIAPCIEETPWNVRLHMLAGSNQAARGRREEAVAAYEEALKYDRRPEIYFALGQQLMHLARTEEAVRHLVSACLIHPDWSDELPEPIRGRVNAEVMRIRRGA